MGSSSSTPSWQTLARLRRRGQKPAGAVWITDDWRQRANLEASGAFALALPVAQELVYLAGLEVILLANPGEEGAAVAQMLAGSSARRLSTYFRGRGLEVVW